MAEISAGTRLFRVSACHFATDIAKSSVGDESWRVAVLNISFTKSW